MSDDGLLGTLVDLLQAEGESSPATRLAEIVVAESFAAPLSVYCAPAELTALLREALAPESPCGDSLLRHLESAWESERRRVAESGETARVALPEEAVEALVGRLGRPSGLPPELGEGLLDASTVREILAVALADTLDEIISRLPLSGGRGGLFGSLARGGGAGGKGLLGMLGSGLREQVRSMAGPAAQVFKERVAARLKTPEGRQALERLRRRAVDRVLDAPLSDLYAALDDPGTVRLGELGIAILRHNLLREEVNDAIGEQWELLVAGEGERSLGELLEEIGLCERFEGLLVPWVAARVRFLAESVEFKEWLAALLADARAAG